MGQLLCQRCGFQLHTTQRIRSKHTGAYFCSDITECDRRTRGELSYEEISLLANRVGKEMRVTCNARLAA